MPHIRMPIADFPELRFGHLLIIGEVETARQSQRKMVCRCDCGNQTVAYLMNLRRGNTKSCGCSLKNKAIAIAVSDHNMTATPEYTAWGSMKTRCNNPNCDMYASYGGRGISVCARWNDFKNFYADMGPRPSKEHSLDRINVNGNYEPENCRWATSDVQSSNTTQNRWITFGGETKTLCQWADTMGIKRPTLLHRLKSGWSIEKALTTPIGG